jgi:hypothetical protein
MLYYVLVLCLVLSQPVIFQDTDGQLFFIGEQVRLEEDVPKNGFPALVDADTKSYEPHQNLLNSDVSILLTSSPKTRTKSKLARSIRQHNVISVYGGRLVAE